MSERDRNNLLHGKLSIVTAIVSEHMALSAYQFILLIAEWRSLMGFMWSAEMKESADPSTDNK